jgi:two-component system, chemotaxis family, response regulator Rcp1
MTGRPIQILMVEDSEADVLLATETLKQAKIANRIHVVDDGVKALEYLRRQGDYAAAVRPDLILLDLNLPRKDGREVLAEIKTDPELCGIPVAILTCSETEQELIRRYTRHAIGYLVKPVDFDSLMRIVRSIEQFGLAVVALSAA